MRVPLPLACAVFLLAVKKVSVHVTSGDVVYVLPAIRAGVRCVCGQKEEGQSGFCLVARSPLYARAQASQRNEAPRNFCPVLGSSYDALIKKHPKTVPAPHVRISWTFRTQA